MDKIISRLDDAVIVFGRFLRQAGCPIGSGEIMNAVHACSYIQIANRQDFRQALRVCLINNYKLLPLFDQLFDIYWRNPDKIQNVSDILRNLYKSRLADAEIKSMKEQIKDIYKNNFDGFDSDNENEKDSEKTYDTYLYSPNEQLKKKRFDSFSDSELKEAKKFINDRKWELPKRKLRRLKPGKSHYRLDIRNTIRNNIFPSQEFSKLNWKQPKIRERSLVVLIDISGSMDHYTRILIHFLHAISSKGNKIEGFTFGTRLTRITRFIKEKNVNDSIEKINSMVKDWSGGTKIGETIKDFNLIWARRILGNGAVVLIVSDGWDTGNLKLLNQEFDRLKKSCYRLIWLNPNLGYQDFEPLTGGVQVMMKYVDNFLPIHNLNCLTDLSDLFSSQNLNKRS